jgi:hypothetical protein
MVAIGFSQLVEVRPAGGVLGDPRLGVGAVLNLGRASASSRALVASVTMRGPPV